MTSAPSFQPPVHFTTRPKSVASSSSIDSAGADLNGPRSRASVESEERFTVTNALSLLDSPAHSASDAAKLVRGNRSLIAQFQALPAEDKQVLEAAWSIIAELGRTAASSGGLGKRKNEVTALLQQIAQPGTGPHDQVTQAEVARKALALIGQGTPKQLERAFWLWRALNNKTGGFESGSKAKTGELELAITVSPRKKAAALPVKLDLKAPVVSLSTVNIATARRFCFRATQSAAQSSQMQPAPIPVAEEPPPRVVLPPLPSAPLPDNKTSRQSPSWDFAAVGLLNSAHQIEFLERVASPMRDEALPGISASQIFKSTALLLASEHREVRSLAVKVVRGLLSDSRFLPIFTALLNNPPFDGRRQAYAKPETLFRSPPPRSTSVDFWLSLQELLNVKETDGACPQAWRLSAAGLCLQNSRTYVGLHPAMGLFGRARQYLRAGLLVTGSPQDHSGNSAIHPPTTLENKLAQRCIEWSGDRQLTQASLKSESSVLRWSARALLEFRNSLTLDQEARLETLIDGSTPLTSKLSPQPSRSPRLNALGGWLTSRIRAASQGLYDVTIGGAREALSGVLRLWRRPRQADNFSERFKESGRRPSALSS